MDANETIPDWRGNVGLVSPTERSGLNYEMGTLLPAGVRIHRVNLDVRQGSLDEFSNALPGFEAKVAELAKTPLDLMHVSGTPPFLMLGYDGERRLIEGWIKKYNVDMFTSGMNSIAALRALGIKSVFHARYTTWDQTDITKRYYEAAGFRMLPQVILDVPFADVHHLRPEEVYRAIKKAFLKSGSGADGIYMQGGGWRVLKAVQWLEQDLGVPVCYSTCAFVWDLQKRLRIREPVAGYGRLMSELP